MLPFKLFITLYHGVFTYATFLVVMISNNVRWLVLALLLLMGIKYSYYYFGRCILTEYETNDYFPTITDCFSKLLTSGLRDEQSEEIAINVALLLVLHKLVISLYIS